MWLGIWEHLGHFCTWDKFIVYLNDNQWHIFNILTMFIITKNQIITLLKVLMGK